MAVLKNVMRDMRQRGRDSGCPLGPSEGFVLPSGIELNDDKAVGFDKVTAG